MLLTITLAQAAKHPKNTKKIIPTFHIMMLGKKNNAEQTFTYQWPKMQWNKQYASQININLFGKYISKSSFNLSNIMGASASWCCTSRLCFRAFILIYINDLSKNLLSNTKIFANDMSFFSTVKNISVSTDQNYLHKKNSIKNWVLNH